LFGLDQINRLGTSRIYGYGDTSIGIERSRSVRYVSLRYQNLVIGPEAAESLVRR